MTTYSDGSIVSRRGPRNPVDPKRPYHFLAEQERAASGEAVSVATIFLTNRECPWRCLMCDLWKNTLMESVSAGDIPRQIEYALERLGAPLAHARGSDRPWHIKLYNSGSFFDAAAIPPGDYPEIARLLGGIDSSPRLSPRSRRRGSRLAKPVSPKFERVIVECHPALIGPRVVEFQKLLTAKLEVAMGLETVHPEVLPRLNKRMTLEMFSNAAAFLREHDIDLRAFVLLKAPFLSEEEGLVWVQRSVEFAFDCGATAVSLIPVRNGNGALEAISFEEPKLESLEAALASAIGLRRGRVFADLWDLRRFSHCAACFPARRARLEQTNLSQKVQPQIECAECQRILTSP
jgi:radical SAM enzyme (TIGR01210 family)